MFHAILEHWFGKQSQTSRRKPRQGTRPGQRHRPLLEMLEERTVPSTYLVNLPGDAGSSLGALSGDLRYCINQANSDAGSTVTFDSQATGPVITLTRGTLTISSDMTIQGPGASSLTISGNNSSQVVSIQSGTVNVAGLTISGGYAQQGGGYAQQGGGIYNAGTLMLTDSTVSGNRTTAIGGFVSDHSYAYGGGIYNAGTLAISGSTLSGNSASGIGEAFISRAEGDGYGGGIYNTGTLTVTNSTLSGNSANGYGGGQKWGYTGPGHAYGGGISNRGTLTVTSSTLFGNQAHGSGDPFASSSYGGGIYNGGTLTVTNSTLSGNDANGGSVSFLMPYYGYGGGLCNASQSGLPLPVLHNTLIASNTTGTYVYLVGSGTEVYGMPDPASDHNLIGDGSGGFEPGKGNLLGSSTNPLNPLLAPLGNYGGPTQTMALLPGSPAINAGSAAYAPATDQRGYPRAGTPDIGAFELQNPATVGVFDPATATWYIRYSNSPGAPDIPPFAYGGAGWVGVSGDWNGDGSSTLGVVDGTGSSHPNFAVWYLKNNNSPGAPDISPFAYGMRSWIPIVGDWTGSGHTGIGVFDPTTATFYLRNSASPGAPDFVIHYGMAGWLPVVGDWDGNGTTTIGVYDPGWATWYLRNSNSPGAPDIHPFAYGMRSWLPVAGAWNGSGSAGIGVFDPSNATWYLRNSTSPGAPDFSPFAYGGAGWQPVPGSFAPVVPLQLASTDPPQPGRAALLSDAELQEALTGAWSGLAQTSIDPTLLAPPFQGSPLSAQTLG